MVVGEVDQARGTGPIAAAAVMWRPTASGNQAGPRARIAAGAEG